MSNKVKDINIENRTFYFFNDIINIEKFEPDDIKIDEKSYKNNSYSLYWICENKKDLKMYSVNPLYLIFRYVNG